MRLPNWMKNSGKPKKTKGVCKSKLKARRQALRALLNKMEVSNK